MSGQRHVIARISPFPLFLVMGGMALLIATGIIGMISEGAFQNPKMFPRAPDRHQYADIPSAIILTLLLVIFLFSTCQYILVIASKFEHAVSIDESIIFFDTFRNETVSVSDIFSVEIIEWNPRYSFKIPYRVIKLSYISRDRGKIRYRTRDLPPFMYQESEDTIIANLAACGVRVTPRQHAVLGRSENSVD